MNNYFLMTCSSPLRLSSLVKKSGSTKRQQQLVKTDLSQFIDKKPIRIMNHNQPLRMSNEFCAQRVTRIMIYDDVFIIELNNLNLILGSKSIELWKRIEEVGPEGRWSIRTSRIELCLEAFRRHSNRLLSEDSWLVRDSSLEMTILLLSDEETRKMISF